jgi:hypothetical protein
MSRLHLHLLLWLDDEELLIGDDKRHHFSFSDLGNTEKNPGTRDYILMQYT